MPVPTATSSPPRRQARSARTRERILEAALVEFGTHGFDGAATRAIAQRAGVHQPQINYHFAGKAELWQAAVDHLFGLLDEALAGVSGPEELVRAFVGFAAEHPELNRIMVQEAPSGSGRLEWLVERHVQARFDLLAGLVDEGLEVLGTRDPLVAWYTLIGAASLLYVNAPEGRLLTGRDPMGAEVRAAHADAVVRMVLGPDRSD
jgi:AcrR family transcriptional regulator